MRALRYTVVAMAILAGRAGAQTPVGATSNGAIQIPGAALGTKAKGNGEATGMMATARHTPQCMHIVTECKQLGFVAGQYKTDNGLWRDCFDPVVNGKGTPTRDGKPITVPANPSDVQACHAAIAANRKGGTN